MAESQPGMRGQTNAAEKMGTLAEVTVGLSAKDPGDSDTGGFVGQDGEAQTIVVTSFGVADLGLRLL